MAKYTTSEETSSALALPVWQEGEMGKGEKEMGRNGGRGIKIISS